MANKKQYKGHSAKEIHEATEAALDAIDKSLGGISKRQRKRMGMPVMYGIIYSLYGEGNSSANLMKSVCESLYSTEYKEKTK